MEGWCDGLEECAPLAASRSVARPTGPDGFALVGTQPRCTTIRYETGLVAETNLVALASATGTAPLCKDR